MKKNNKNNPVVPEKFYPNSDTCKEKILSENTNKSGVYCLTNLLNGKQYIGSSNNLRRRFLQYFNTNYLIRDDCMSICRSLLKNGYSNFSLEILEYCKSEYLIKREKDYIDLLLPKYNIIKDPTIPPFLNRTHSEESRKKMSDAKQGENHPRYGKSKAEGAGKSSQKIKVIDTINNTTVYYNSMSETAKALNISSHKIISQYISYKQQTPYKNRYIFIKID